MSGCFGETANCVIRIPEKRAGEFDLLPFFELRRLSTQRSQHASSDKSNVNFKIAKPAMSRVGKGGIPGPSR
jgi:hypothetical protein